MFRRLLLSILLLTMLTVGHAAPPAHLDTAINDMIAGFRQQKSCRGAKIGILIRSLDDNALWYAKAADKPFIPASTGKLVVTATALEFLPEDFRFSTRLYADGEIKDGVLQGNLILRGGGDPTITADDLRTLAHALATGDEARHLPPVHCITGRLILDDSAFPVPGTQWGEGWEKEDLPFYYAAPTSALCCNRNALLITVHGSTPGAPATVTLTPETQFFTVVNHTVTSTAVSTGAIGVTIGRNRLTISGRVAPNAELTEKISVRDPDKFLAGLFRHALALEAITLQGQQTGLAQTKTLLAEHQSALLPDVIMTMLKESDNHTAEQLRWTLLSQLQCASPPAKRYLAILQDLAQRAGIAKRHLQMVDGSGLSRLSRLCPDDLVRLLTYMHQSPHYDALYQALPIAGVDGTLKKRMIGTPAAGNARMKTGTMRSVCTLAGYVTTAHGEHLVVAIFVNGYASKAAPARALQDHLVSYLAGL